VPAVSPLVQAVRRRGLEIIGELELGFQQARCLSIAISGTNGKGTTAELVERVLGNSHRQAVVCGHRARPICSAVDQSRELDFLILKVNSFQLEPTRPGSPGPLRECGRLRAGHRPAVRQPTVL
jgi:UDP-N-acetylmuramoylalanine--D-glutamate ligase